jgi:adenylate kinase family enzyme
MKISIIGFSGSGKSTLARFLGEKYNIPVLHLDKVQWLPGWQERNLEEKKTKVSDFLNSNTSWVIDGNYSSLSYDRRLDESNMIIFMAFNRFSCLYRATKRAIKYHNRTREDMGEGCNDKMDFEFAMWILRDGRNKKAMNRYRNVMNKYGNKVIVIKNQRQLDKFMREQEMKTNEEKD